MQKKLNRTSMTEHKADMSSTEKQNSTSLMEHKTDMNFSEKLSNIFTTKH